MKSYIGIFLVFALFLLAGCSSEGPSTQMELSESSITVQDQVLSDFITVKITREDDGNQTDFVIKFPKNSSFVYPADVDGESVTSLQTKPLRGKNAQDVLQFKVYATNLDFEEAIFELPIELWWNDTIIQSASLQVKVVK